MSSVSPGQEHVPFSQGQNLTLIHNDYVTFQFQGLLYNPEMCRKNCGFYGNPAWHGYCSRCWIQKRQQTPPLTSSFRHHSTHLCKPDMGAGYQQDIVNRKPYACPQNDDHSAKASVLPLFNSCLPSLGQGSFSDFLKALHRPDAQELLTHCTNFIQMIQNANNLTVDEKADDVQNLYKQIGDHIPDTSEEKDQLLDNIEKLVMTRLYKSVFCMDGPHEEQKDLSLQNHIRSLGWVTPKILQFSLCEHDEEVNDQIASAVTALLEMDSKRAPQDKLACVTKACDHLFKAIDVSTKEPATTDDLISGLIYITIKANPPHLFSNLKYITRFCNPRRLMTGKCAYWFTNVVSIYQAGSGQGGVLAVPNTLSTNGSGSAYSTPLESTNAHRMETCCLLVFDSISSTLTTEAANALPHFPLQTPCLICLRPWLLLGIWLLKLCLIPNRLSL